MHLERLSLRAIAALRCSSPRENVLEGEASSLRTMRVTPATTVPARTNTRPTQEVFIDSAYQVRRCIAGKS
jgi:hypothetical protein